MVFIRSANLMALHTPMRYPQAAQLHGNMHQFSLYGYGSDPIPYSRFGKLDRSAAPFPYKTDAHPSGMHARVQQVLPMKPPPGWLPQTTYRYYGRDNAASGTGGAL